MLHPATQHWKPPVLILSAARKDGIEKFWETIESYRATLSASGDYAIKRRRQAQAWMWTLIDSGLRERFHAHPDVQSALKEVSCEVEAGSMTPTAAANRLLDMAQQRA
jgi:LAO/AO transport system kinase